MKKLIAFVLGLVCILSLSACSFKNDVPTFDDIQDYTEEDFEIYLNHIKRDALIKEWGEPSKTSENADTWVLNEKRTVTIIYDTSDRVKDAGVGQTWRTYTIDVTENSVGEIGRGTYNFPIKISEDDANALSEIINGGTWIEELTECASDCVINLKGHWTQYNSESGILNKYNLK